MSGADALFHAVANGETTTDLEPTSLEGSAQHLQKVGFANNFHTQLLRFD